jgi:hypothetical protein
VPTINLISTQTTVSHEGKIKTSSDEWKLREFIASRTMLKECLKEALQTGRNDKNGRNPQKGNENCRMDESRHPL